MDYSEMRDGRWQVYIEGVWIGTARQTPSGSWVFFGRLGSNVYGMAPTLDGAIRQAMIDANGEVLEQVQMFE